MQYLALLATLAGLAASQDWTQPQGPEPIGNPFRTPELNEQVPVGQPFEVTWDPTIDAAGTVTILLLRGPSENAVPQYPIAQNIPNSGSFTWTPAADLETDDSRYGLQLIVDATGQYQYTPQFGISGGSGGGEEQPGYPTATDSRPPEPSYATSIPDDYPTEYPTGTAVPPVPSASHSNPVYVTTSSTITTCISSTTPPPAGTGYPVVPPPVVSEPAPPAPPAPSNPVPQPPVGSQTGGEPPIQTGAAVKVGVSGVLALVGLAAVVV